jgi:hypothetical protein
LALIFGTTELPVALLLVTFTGAFFTGAWLCFFTTGAIGATAFAAGLTGGLLGDLTGGLGTADALDVLLVATLFAEEPLVAAAFLGAATIFWQMV